MNREPRSTNEPRTTNHEPRTVLCGVVFDFDGVIADTEPLHFRTSRKVLADAGITLAEADYYARYLGYDDAGVFRAVSRDHGVTLSEGHVLALIARKAHLFEELLEGEEVLFPDATACVRRVAGVVPIAIASGARRPEIEAVLRRAGLLELIRGIVAAGDVAHSKPAPDPYLAASRALRCEPAAIVAIEDSHWGLVAARAAGLRTIAVTNTYPASELTAADFVVSSLDEITLDRLAAVLASPGPISRTGDHDA